MKLRKLVPWLVGAVSVATPRPAWAEAASPRAPIVVRYEAPAECPSAEAFAASVRAELVGRRWDAAEPLQVQVVVAGDGHGYTATIASSREAGAPLERSVSATTCAEAIEMAAAIVTLAQNDVPDVEVAPAPLPTPPPRGPGPAPPMAAPPHEAKSLGSEFVYSFTLGYSAFTSGPANPVVRGNGEQTTFNPALGVRLGFGVTHALGWWKHSLNVSAAYYRQGTSTKPSSAPFPPTNDSTTNSVSLDDRDVLLATIDACPVQLDYKFLSVIPCATFSMMQSRGQSGNDPGLETGLGGSARIRAAWGWFFGELMGTVIRVSSSYEPPSQSVRAFYALSAGVLF